MTPQDKQELAKKLQHPRSAPVINDTLQQQFKQIESMTAEETAAFLSI